MAEQPPSQSRVTTAEILRFWFEGTRPRQCFAKDPAFDDLLRERLIDLTRQAIKCGVSGWAGWTRKRSSRAASSG
jgi:uncharacterized protein (DUF924 family)